MTIKCPLCDFENEEGSKFCSNCNIPLVKQDYSEGNPYIKKKWKENDEVVESHIEVSESKGTNQSLSSTIRRWDINKENEIKHLHTYKITPEMLFASTIHGICVFGKDDPKREKIPEFQKAGLDMCNNFGRDASLFEVGCYLFFRLGLWLFHNSPDLRYSISKYFGKEFSKLFAIALNMDIDNVIDLFNERGSMYADIVSKREDWAEESHLILSSLVLKTKDNNLPKSYRGYKFEEMPLELGAICKWQIKMHLARKTISIIPILINNLKKNCDLFEEQI